MPIAGEVVIAATGASSLVLCLRAAGDPTKGAQRIERLRNIAGALHRSGTQALLDAPLVC